MIFELEPAPSAARETGTFTPDVTLADLDPPAVAPTWGATETATDPGTDDDAPDLAALLALAAGPSEPELEPVELDDDSLSEAFDAAVRSVPDGSSGTMATAAAAPSAATSATSAASALAGLELMPMDDDVPFPVSAPAPRSERVAPTAVSQIVFDELDADPLDAEPVVLTPGVDLSEPRGTRPSAQSGGRGARLAAVDAVVQLSAAASPPPRTGGLRGFLRRLLGR